MALIVTCKNMTDAIEALHQITMEIQNNKIPSWEVIGTNQFQNTKNKYEGKACFRPTIRENKLYFGLINPNMASPTVSKDLYDYCHSAFYDVLVHLSWRFYFTLEQTPERLADLDARIV